MAICNNNDNGGNEDDAPPCWPTAAASRIKITLKSKADNQTSHYRLFYNRTTGAIELVHCHDNDDNDDNDTTQQQRTIYDDSNINIENEPDYQSYLATSTNENRIIVDSFHPNDVIGANLSLEYNANNPNTFHGMASYSVAKFNIYSYPKSDGSKKNNNNKNKNGKRRACHKHYTLDSKCCEDFADARSILQTIQKLSKLRNNTIHNNSNLQNKAPLKCLVILNPFSGGGGPNSKSGARNVYVTIVKPMLEEASVDHDALVTERGGHARERMYVRTSNDGVQEQDDDDNDKVDKSTTSQRNNNATNSKNTTKDSITTDDETKDISEYDAIIAMGGDGIQFEIFQGIHDRSCSQSSSSSSSTTTADSISNDSNNDDDALEAILSKLKFGIVACGTYNGLVKSLLHWSACDDDDNDDHGNDNNNNNNSNFDCVESVFQICKGYTSTLDVASYKVLSNTVTDYDNADSPTNPTTSITTATATTTTRKSKSYLSFLSFAWGLIADCDFESECLRWLGPLRSDVWAVYRGIFFRRQYRGRFSYLPPATAATSSGASSGASSGVDGSGGGEGSMMMGDNDDDGNVVVEMPQVGKPLPNGWVSFDEEEFLVFWVCNTSHAAYNMYTCPMARMNDGLFHVLIVRWESCVFFA